MPRTHQQHQQQQEQQPMQGSVLQETSRAVEPRRRSIVSKLGKLTKRLRLSHRDSIVTTMPAFCIADMPVRGTIVITRRHICFSPALPGFNAEVKLKFSDIISICKEKVFSLFPTGIRIKTAQRTVTFSNLGSRDRLLKQLQSAWGASTNFAVVSSASALADCGTASAAARQAEVPTDESGDSGFDASSPAAEHQQRQDEPRPDDHRQEASDGEVVDENEDEDERYHLAQEPTEKVPSTGSKCMTMPIYDGLTSAVSVLSQHCSTRVDNWISVGGILCLVLLALCTVSAISLAFRVNSLQQRFASLNSDQFLTGHSSAPGEQPSPYQSGQMLSEAITSLSVMTHELDRLSRSIIESSAEK